MFNKVKGVVYGAGVAGLAGVAGYLGNVDWSQFGNFGPAIGLAVGAAVAWAVKETKGYGAGRTTKER